jgi:hypothetical protein
MGRQSMTQGPAFFGDIYNIMAAIYDTGRLFIHKMSSINRKEDEEKEEYVVGAVCEECKGAPLNLVSVLPDGRRIYSYGRIPMHTHHVIKY